MILTTSLKAVLPALLISLAACAHGGGEPIVGDSPLGVGHYSFIGSVTGENRYANRAETFSEMVSGVVEVRENGDVRLTSPHGSCEGGRVDEGMAVVNCRGIDVRLGPQSGSARIPVEELREFRSSECAQSIASNVGGTARSCVRYHTEIRRVVTTKAATVSVVRDH
jgi:hypothetical protein